MFLKIEVMACAIKIISLQFLVVRTAVKLYQRLSDR